MKRSSKQAEAWIVDYSAAREEAIRWLGDRYLLARPVNVRPDRQSKLPLAILQSMPSEIPDAVVPLKAH